MISNMNSSTGQTSGQHFVVDFPEITDETVLPLCTRTKVYPVEELRSFVMSYTQVVSNSDNSPIRPDKQGFNRDAVEVSAVLPDLAVCAVADGCSLRYWSEVAANIAVKRFVSYIERYIWNLGEKDDLTIGKLKQLMVEGVMYTNNELLSLIHPKTRERVGIEENGGQTTLAAAVVFPFCAGLWGVIAIGMGDSEALLFVKGVVGCHWVSLTQDIGSPMLPFSNLKESHIGKPSLQLFDKNSVVFLFSDGVRDSFPDSELPPLPEELESNTWHMVKYLMEKTFQSHTNNKTDPDDVCMGAIRPRECNSELVQYANKGYPHREAQVDMTEIFYPDFCKESGYNSNFTSEFFDPTEEMFPNLKKSKLINAWISKSTKAKKYSRSIRRSFMRGSTAPARVEYPEPPIDNTVTKVKVEEEKQDPKRKSKALNRSKESFNIRMDTKPKEIKVTPKEKEKEKDVVRYKTYDGLSTEQNEIDSSMKRSRSISSIESGQEEPITPVSHVPKHTARLSKNDKKTPPKKKLLSTLKENNLSPSPSPIQSLGEINNIQNPLPIIEIQDDPSEKKNNSPKTLPSTSQILVISPRKHSSKQRKNLIITNTDTKHLDINF
eukprot:TRINITY_DN26965_c0_g1_i1.p1 TRINITY_DN26965_c0_g1~~TRINITY_DN26965_c0_g1_i1.p1  ORF type:complete len:606 (-),score=118.85 TRINITY_DN26965_c0_g1_i1:27-1844(-)